ncbi:hypothetical protein [Nonomuraea sp. NPDC048916]|uniref:hypothetical protein n=1 Tax=Nonomuraea sp. NPDC048916 TaxID=3154232 RepID=UPI00340CF4CB
MDITHSTAPGIGVVHHVHTQEGHVLSVIHHLDGRRTLLVYDSTPDAADPDRPTKAVDLDGGEADQLADLLHSRSVAERLAAIERVLAGRADGQAR